MSYIEEDLRIKYILTQDKDIILFIISPLHGSSERRQTHAKQKNKNKNRKHQGTLEKQIDNRKEIWQTR